MRKVLATLSVAFIVIGFVNFFLFFAESIYLGGDALNGYSKDGHYFVSEHGNDKEVSEREWRYSRLHAISAFITGPLAVISGIYLMSQFVYPGMFFLKDRASLEPIVESISKGQLIEVITCGGKIGGLAFKGPMLRVKLFPSGLVVKPHLMPAFGIELSQIKSISIQHGWIDNGVEIDYDSDLVLRPLFLRCLKREEFLSALQSRTTGLWRDAQSSTEAGGGKDDHC